MKEKFKQILEEGAPMDLLQKAVPELPQKGLEEVQTLLRATIWPEDMFDGEHFLLPVRTKAQAFFLERLGIPCADKDVKAA